MNLLHVNIVGASGALLADVDAVSVADGLAYYLRSRGIVEGVTPADVLNQATPPVETERDQIVFEQRDPITGVLECQLLARVEP